MELRISGGGTIFTQFVLNGEWIRFLHLDISGSWLFKTRIVFCVAVAVIKRTFPDNPLISPEEMHISGRKARLDPLAIPQLATVKKNNIRT